MKKYAFLFVNFCLLLALSSCSNDDYTKALPTASTALMYVDADKSGGVGSDDLLQRLLHTDGVGGLDLAKRIYFFELADGSAGMCARVSDAKKVGETLEKLAKNGRCREISELGGVQTAVLDSVFGQKVLAYDDNALLVMNLATATEMQATKNRLVRYLKQDGERSEKFTRLFEKLNAMESPIAAVGRGQTLLKTFTFDLPDGLDASQVMDAISYTLENGVVHAKNRRFSFNEKVDKALNESEKILRPIQGRYAPMMSSGAFLGLMINVEGGRLLPKIQNEEIIKATLAAANAVIDMNNIVKSIDGEVAVNYFGDLMFGDGKYSLAAELAHSEWLADVGYWKTSCPKGSEIKDWGKDSYCYTDRQSVLYFGVVGEPKNARSSASSQSSQQFFCGNTSEVADSPLQPVQKPISADVAEKIKGSRFALVMNMEKAVYGQLMKAVCEPFVGDFRTYVYTLEQ